MISEYLISEIHVLTIFVCWVGGGINDEDKKWYSRVEQE